jgi:hypothetical protein
MIVKNVSIGAVSTKRGFPTAQPELRINTGGAFLTRFRRDFLHIFCHPADASSHRAGHLEGFVFQTAV